MNILFLNPTRRVELINMFKIYLKELGSSINVACYEAFDPTMHIADVGIHLQKNWRIKDLIAICQTYEISLIIPWLENDMINLLDNSNVLKDHNIKLAMNTSRHMHIAFSKKKTIDFLKELDVNVMPYMNRQKINKFPLVVKPDLGSGGIGVNVVNNEIELNNYLENDSTLIIQEYLNGVEYTVDLFCNKGKVLGSVPRKRVKFRAGEVLISQTINRPDLIEMCSKICNAFEFSGPINIQFIEDSNGIPWCTDINPRVSGGIPLSIKAGLNIPKGMIDLFVFEKNPEFNVIEWNLVSTRWHESLYIKSGQEVSSNSKDLTLVTKFS